MFWKKKIVYFHLVKIQIVFLPTIGTGTLIYVFSNTHELFSWLCILTYFLYIYEFWFVKNVCLYYFRGIAFSLITFFLCVSCLYLSVYLSIYLSIYNLLMPFSFFFLFFFFLPLRLALTTNRFHTKQKLNYVVIIFFFFLNF